MNLIMVMTVLKMLVKLKAVMNIMIIKCICVREKVFVRDIDTTSSLSKMENSLNEDGEKSK